MQEKIKLWEKLKNQRLDDLACAKICNISRATLYRYKKQITELENGIPLPTRARLRQNQPKWGQTEIQLVLQVRQQNPTFGKEKITVILKRDYNKSLSLSNVGRIITLLLAAGIIQKLRAAPTARRRQIHNGYAQRKPFKEYSNATLGEDVQIDQTSITINGRTYKLFQAWDRCSKLIFSYLYCDAKSATAKNFLIHIIKTTPFKIKSIQVDGGSEFRGKFEQACASLNIPSSSSPQTAKAQRRRRARKPNHQEGVLSASRNSAQKHHRHPTPTPKSRPQIQLLQTPQQPCRTHPNAVHSKILSQQQKGVAIRLSSYT